MARPKLPAREVRRRKDIWLSDDEWARVEAAAEIAGLPVRAYARRAILGQRITPPPTVADRQAWAELARVHANLNQIAHKLNAGEQVPDSEISAALDECNVLTKALRNAILLGPDS